MNDCKSHITTWMGSPTMVVQEVDFMGETIRNVVDVAAVELDNKAREALIKLGWTPPKPNWDDILGQSIMELQDVAKNEPVVNHYIHLQQNARLSNECTYVLMANALYHALREAKEHLVNVMENRTQPAVHVIKEPMSQRIKSAIEVAVKYGNVGGESHKSWVIDQMVRFLAADSYESTVALAKYGVDGMDTYSWDVGIAP